MIDETQSSASTLAIVSDACGRRGRYNVERLIAAHGADAKLAYLLLTLPDCLKAGSISVPDRCNAVYEGL
jgi:hypothetical protein